MVDITYANPDSLDVDDFLSLVDRVWPGTYDRSACASAVERTLNLTAWG